MCTASYEDNATLSNRVVTRQHSEMIFILSVYQKTGLISIFWGLQSIYVFDMILNISINLFCKCQGFPHFSGKTIILYLNLALTALIFGCGGKLR
jgi:hypothetical protein